MNYLLDTNIVSFAIKHNPIIIQKINDVKTQRNKMFISCITYFEIKRGFFAVKSPKQLATFEQISQDYQIIFLDDLAILEKAAEIYANLRLRGLPIQTEDILIAATAIVKDFILVSQDTDFTRISDLKLESWL